MHNLKIAEQKGMKQKIAENTDIGKLQKPHSLKMTDWKMHNIENGRKYTYWKMTENTQLENNRTENAQDRKWHKIHIPKNGRKCTPGQ